MAGNRQEISDQLIEQYVSITGSDKDSAKHLLDAFDGDLERAVNMYLEGSGAPNIGRTTKIGNGGGGGSKSPILINEEGLPSSSSSSNSLSNSSKSIDIPGDDDVRAPIPQRQAVLVEDEFHALPYQRPRRQNSRSVFDGFRDFRKETEEQERLLQDDRRGATTSKKKRLHELFKPPVDILHTGNFQSARNRSTSASKWLLVNIQNTMEFASQVLNRDIWSNKVVRDIIKENFIMWQVYHDSDEGQHYATFYQVKSYPHLSVIDPRTGERMVVWENLGMKPSANQFAELAAMFLADNPTFNGEAVDSNEIDMKVTATIDSPSLIDRSEDAQLEAAIEASLHVAKLPSIISIEDDEEGTESIPDDDDNSDVEITDGDDDVVVRKPIIPEENTDSSSPSLKKRKVEIDLDDNQPKKSSETKTKTQGQTTTPIVSTDEKRPTVISGETVKILLRTPTNERKQLIISHEATLEDLAKEVSTLGWSSSRYELVKPYPRQNLSSLDQTTTLKSAGLHKQETIFIQDR